MLHRLSPIQELPFTMDVRSMHAHQSHSQVCYYFVDEMRVRRCLRTSVSSHVLSPKTLKGLNLNFVSVVYTKTCRVGFNFGSYWSYVTFALHQPQIQLHQFSQKTDTRCKTHNLLRSITFIRNIFRCGDYVTKR
jgi:hypothetical protein